MSIICRSIVMPWLFLLGSMQDPKAATSDPELANIPAAHGVALFVQLDLANSLVEVMLHQEGKTKAGESLRKELGLKDDQLPKLKDLSTRACNAAAEGDRGKFAPDRFFEIEEEILLEGLPDILTKPQMTRFEQLYCQIEGLAILRVPVYATRIGLSDDQRTEIRALAVEYQEKSNEHHRAIFSSRAGDDALLVHLKPLKSLARELDSKIIQVLTARQRAAWKGFVGEKFQWDETLKSLDYKPDP